MRNLYYILQTVCLTIFLTSTMYAPVAALPSVDDRALRYDSIYYDRDASSLQNCPAGGSSIQNLPSEVPQPYRDLFPKAAEAHDADLALLTFVFWQENGGRFPSPDTDWPTSDAGAEGPFQFMPKTWAGHGVDGDGDGDKDVQDVVDATYGAANFLNSLGGTPDSPIGSIDTPYQRGTLVYAMGAYNFGPASMKKQKPLPKETRNYIARGVPFISNLYSGTVSAGAEADSGGNTSTSGTVFTQGCGGLGIGEDLVFPLKTTKTKIRQGSAHNGQRLRWCYQNQTNCHSSQGADDLYKAADIFVEPGTKVVTAVSGTVIELSPGGASLSVKIHGDDGNYYFYQHLEPHSQTISLNDHVEAGHTLGVIGEASAAENTAPHLHFDVATENVGISRECVSEGSCDYQKSVMIDAQPDLVEAYNNLPEN